jgi:hypothetical protein
MRQGHPMTRDALAVVPQQAELALRMLLEAAP